MAKKEELKELDLGAINEIIETNSAPDAKSKIQVYAKECGFKISKSNISVEDMVTKLLEMADAKENEKLESSPMNKIKTPEVSIDVKSISGDEELSLAEEVEEFDIVEPKGLPLKPGEIVAIQDLQEDIKNEIVDAIQSGSVTISAPITSIEDNGIVSNAPSNIVQDVKIIPVDGDGTWYPPAGFNVGKLKDEEEEPDMSGFTPRINLIGAVGQQYMNCPYWILDWILENGKEWKTKIHNHPRTTDQPLLKTVLYYIQIHGSVTVRESRNSRFHTLY